MSRADHPLFRSHPLDGVVDVDGAAEPTPYHLYDGLLALLGGHVDADAARALLSPLGLAPVTNAQGRALGCVWVGEFPEASLGPHSELQISLLATSTSTPAVATHRYAVLRALAVRDDVVMVCHGLWNNTPRVVRYNQAHLGLDAHAATSAVGVVDGRLRFRFIDADGQLIAEGNLAAPARQSAGPLWRALLHLGFAGMAAGAKPALHVAVANPISAWATRVQVAHTYSKPDAVVLRAVDEGDALRIAHPRYASLQFVPEFVELLRGVRFVYGRPVDDARLKPPA
jgi:hypothetical protein